MTTYYDVGLKERRLGVLKQHPDFTPVEALVEEPGRILGLVADSRPEAIIHLAAQAGVRYSIDAPRAYVEANLAGTFECWRRRGRTVLRIC